MTTHPATIPPFMDYPEVPVPHAASGPLAGLGFGVKDIFDVAGYPTGCGNPTKRAEAAPATAHAACVARLLDAGARFVAKTHTVELAFGLDGTNDHFGTPANPAAPDRVPGGSSSGSVAAAGAGLVDFALGSDTGGSVRAPASFGGLIGLRTSFGRVDIAGTMPLAESFDTVGWFARDAEVYERVGAVLLGEDAEGPALTAPKFADDAFAVLAEGERAAFAPGLARVEAVLGAPAHVTLAEEGLAAWRQVFRDIQGFEAWRNHRDWIAAHPGKLTAPVARRFAEVSRLDQATCDAARAKRAEIAARMKAKVGEDGVIVLPTMPSAAPRLGTDDAGLEGFRIAALALTCPAGLAGLPQITLPLATFDGAPLGLSLIGPAGRDRALIALGRRILGV